MPRTDLIDLLLNESSPIQNHFINTTQPLYPINTTLDTTLSLTIPSPTTNQTILTQGTMVSLLAPRALVFSTPPSSPLEPHPYLSSLNDLPPRSSNPQPQILSQVYYLNKLLPAKVGKADFFCKSAGSIPLGSRKRISDKRTKNQTINDKTEHGMEKRGKDKVKSKPKTKKSKSSQPEKSTVKPEAKSEEY
ncbi:hypothetical protein Tco_0755176 [Tanacetum coccineum]